MISEKVKNQIHVEQGDITKLDCDCICLLYTSPSPRDS